MRLSWANRITILRILLIIPFVSCMLKINDPVIGEIMRYISIAIYTIMLISDILDGYFARMNNQVTRLGAFLDPTADKILITCACLLLVSNRAGIKGFPLPPTVVVFIIGRDVFLLIGFIIIYFITSKLYIVRLLIGKITGRLQLVMVAGILIAPDVSRLLPGWIWFLRVLWWSAAGTAILATLIYFRNGSRYIEQCEQKNASRQA